MIDIRLKLDFNTEDSIIMCNLCESFLSTFELLL